MADGKRGNTKRGSGLPADLSFYGTVVTTSTNALVLPKRAREELAFGDDQPIFVFGSPSQGRAILTAGQHSPDELIELLSGQAKRA